MGTDIHTFLEYSDDIGRQGFSGDPSLPALLFGHFALSRDYTLFNALGDGRNVHLDSSEIERNALFSPRGIPIDISHAVAREYYDLIADLVVLGLYFHLAERSFKKIKTILRSKCDRK